MKLQITKHEDERRILTEWNKDIPMKRCKIIQTKGKVELGNHYHEKSDSIFYIFKGKGLCIVKDLRGNTVERKWLFESDGIFVERNLVHTFTLFPETIMLEAASEPYDEKDEIQVA